MSKRPLHIASVTLLTLASPAIGGEWSSDFGPPATTSGSIEDVVLFEDQWVAVGYFWRLLGTDARNVAVSDNLRTWSQLGPTMSGYLYATTVFDSQLVVAGSFEVTVGDTTALAAVAEWYDGAWRRIGDVDIDGTVVDMVVYQDRLIIGGSFVLQDGDSTYANVAAWDGTYWRPVANVNAAVRALDIAEGHLIIGGAFTQADGVPMPHVIVYNGDECWPLGGGPGGAVSDVTSLAGDVVVSGSFPGLVARWTGIEWEPIGEELEPGLVVALTTFEDELVAGGLLAPDSETYYSLAAWRAGKWVDLGGPSDDLVSGLRVVGPHLFVFGYFREVDGRPSEGLAVWDGSVWNANLSAGLGLTNEVKTLLSVGDELWVGGYSIPRLYHGDGRGWVSSGWWAGPIFTMTVHEERLYVGGIFGVSGGTGPYGISMQTDSGGWEPVGGGVEYGVNALLSAGDLFVGGNFTFAGEVTTGHIASWDGAEWDPLNGGMNDHVRALAYFRGDVVAAGDFTTAGGVPVSGVAAWDGTEWRPLGDGLSGIVRVLLETDDALIAGGEFRASGSRSVGHIARWDGGSWTPLGTGLDGPVHALARSGRHLVVGGSFQRAGDVDASNIAHWDGAAWHPVDGGVSGRVSALAFHEDVLYAGGLFTEADGLESRYIGAWRGTFDTPTASGSVFRMLSPQPATRDVAIHYVLPQAGKTRVTLHDVAGRRVATLLDTSRPAGAHTFVWHGTDDDGRTVPSGVYFLRMTSGGSSDNRRLVVVR